MNKYFYLLLAAAATCYAEDTVLKGGAKRQAPVLKQTDDATVLDLGFDRTIDFSRADTWARLAQPALVVRGAQSPWGEGVDALTRDLASPRVVDFRRSSRMPFHEEQEKFAKVLEKFLGR